VRWAALVGVACVALLGLALLWSARLVEDVPTPAVAMAPVAPSHDEAPRARLAPEPTPAPPPVPAVVSPAPAPPPEPRVAEPPPPAARAPAVATGAPAAEIPPELLADDPFGEVSREIDYAFKLATDPASTEALVRNAAEVFERCLKAKGADERCYRGLVMAQRRLETGEVPALPAPVQNRPAAPERLHDQPLELAPKHRGASAIFERKLKSPPTP
jgi:hypothetical protein